MNKRKQKKVRQLSLRLARRILRHWRACAIQDGGGLQAWSLEREARLMVAYSKSDECEYRWPGYRDWTKKRLFEPGRDCCQWFDDWARALVGDL